MDRERVLEQLKAWRDSLVNLTKRNRLLYYKPSKAGLSITGVSSPELLDRLTSTRAGLKIGVATEPEPGSVVVRPPDSDIVAALATPEALNRVLKGLERRSVQDFMERGLWVLYLALGILKWEDRPSADGPAEYVSSPLLLLPVCLKRSGQGDFRLFRTDDEAVLNPALSIKLQNDFGISLPPFEPGDEDDSLTDVFRAIAGSVASKPTWEVTDHAVVGLFSFHKEAMYRDLMKNAEQVATHPFVEALALGHRGGAGLAFDPVPEQNLDELHPPEMLNLVLDADASQRQCLAAADQGRSFVIEGPPGTGKSQTITNTIAQALARGKTVLFVSEKIAALEVVQSRLEKAGLSEFLLELHSHKATRKRIAQELGRSLALRVTAQQGRRNDEIEQARSLRTELSHYAEAVHAIRAPLGRSVFGVLGQLVSWQTHPQAPAAEYDSALTAKDLAHVRGFAESLITAWGPVERGEQFVWRYLRDTQLSQHRKTRLAGVLSDASATLQQMRAMAAGLSEESGIAWRSGAEDFYLWVNLLRHLRNRPPFYHAWLYAEELASVRALLVRRQGAVGSMETLREKLNAGCGMTWRLLDPELERSFAAAERDVERDVPFRIWELVSTWPAGLALAGRLEAAAAALDESLGLAQSIAAECGASPVDSIEALDFWFDLAALATQVPPKSSWGASLLEAKEAHLALKPLCLRARTLRLEFSQFLSEEILTSDVDGLCLRFRDVHVGLGKLRPRFWRDRRVVKAVSLSGSVTSREVAALQTAADYRRVRRALDKAESKHRDVLGEYYDSESTDFPLLEQALNTATAIFEKASSRLPAPKAFEALGSRSEARTRLAEQAREGKKCLSEYRQLTQGLDHFSEPSPSRLCVALHKAAAAVRRISKVTEGVSDALEMPSASFQDVREWLSMVATLALEESELTASAAGDTILLGPHYRGVETDFGQLELELAWVEAFRDQLRGVRGESLAVVAQLDASHTPIVEDLWRTWEAAVESLVNEFEPPYSDDVSKELQSTYESVTEYLDLLLRTLDDIAEWGTYARAVAGLQGYGLSKAVGYCIQSRLRGDQLPAVLQRSVLDQWLDSTIASDPRLAENRAARRDQLLANFRELDSKIATSGTSSVVHACNAKRPTAAFGSTALLQTEAAKQRRHMPTRTLMERAGAVVQAIKPCMMMSPLSVSQFLPSRMTFDVVIFDEASQVRPADAINCIYRGNQLIVAGDSKQLPPTSFFERSEDNSEEWDEDQLDDFQSVLDIAKGAGCLTTISLRWHYRSQHEDLITYSNYSFYDGALVTFPAAKIAAPDLGIEAFIVPGVYRRGGARDNPIEARKVVERLVHHLTHNPGNSIGVVAFSEAQASAIDHEIDSALTEHPQLQAMRSQDRLAGGFVKNLESVQGDERDIIIFSVGYGPDEVGKFTLNFGPVSRPGGARRLNVAITRARKRVEVVSSIPPALFSNIGDSSSEGVRHLRRYLDYVGRSENRLASLAIDVGPGLRDTESPFEEEVARVVRSWGYDVALQVGCGDYRIDLAVRHPDFRDVYLLGIECDGAMYHSSKVARDRDRLREEVLRKLGWQQLHRIWGLSWYSDRGSEEARLRNAINAALDRFNSPESYVGPAWASAPAVVEAHGVELVTTPDWVVDYAVCRLGKPNVAAEIHEGVSQAELRRMVLEVVSVEAPVASELVLRRVRQAWGLQRAGARARSAFDAAIRSLKSQKQVDIDRDGFLLRPHMSAEIVRRPVEGEPETTRLSTEVPPSELQRAMLRFVAEAHGISEDELGTRVAGLFGWARRGPDISSAMKSALTALTRGRRVRRDGDMLRLGEIR